MATNHAPSTDSANDAWSGHEHVSGPVQAQAKSLVDQAGSVELAKHAVESVAAPENSGDPKDAFARDLGFSSYLELFETASPVRAVEDRTWLLAATPSGTWVAWTEQDLAAAQTFESMESALATVRGGVGADT